MTSVAWGMMENMGWKEGQGLGKDNQGLKVALKPSKKVITTCVYSNNPRSLSHTSCHCSTSLLQVDNAGLGKSAQSTKWVEACCVYDSILAKLNQKYGGECFFFFPTSVSRFHRCRTFIPTFLGVKMPPNIVMPHNNNNLNLESMIDSIFFFLQKADNQKLSDDSDSETEERPTKVAKKSQDDDSKTETKEERRKRRAEKKQRKEEKKRKSAKAGEEGVAGAGKKDKKKEKKDKKAKKQEKVKEKEDEEAVKASASSESDKEDKPILVARHLM
jgi:hypothetical protein